MATPKPSEEQTRLDLNERDAKEITQSFVYRDDMDLSKVAQYLDTDWEDAYNTMNDLLKQAKMDDE
jgi:hypothetical protein